MPRKEKNLLTEGDNESRTTPQLPTYLKPFQTHAVHAVGVRTGLVGGDSQAARGDPQVALGGQGEQDEVAVNGLDPLEGLSLTGVAGAQSDPV